MSIQLNAIEDLVLPNYPEAGTLADAATALGISASDMCHRLLHGAMTLAVDVGIPGRPQSVVSVPPHTVTGAPGLAQSDVLVIGKQPNFDDVECRRNFASSAGDLWKGVLASAGVDISNWMLTNVCWFRVPDRLTFSKRFTREFETMLRYVVSVVNPKYVLLFGADALKAFWSLKDPKLGPKMKFKERRGAIEQWNERVTVMGTFHPSNVLADPVVEPEFRLDLQKFAKLVSGQPTETVRSDEILYIDNANDLNALVDRLIMEGHTRFALDAEWGDGNWMNGRLRLIQFSWAAGRGCVVRLRDTGMTDAFKPSPFAAIPILGRLLKRPGVCVGGHNLRGDLKWLSRAGLDLLEEFTTGGLDTMLAHHLLFEQADQQLELVAMKLLGVPRYDTELRDWLGQSGLQKEDIADVGYGTVPREILEPYAAMDAIVSFELWDVLLAMLQEVPELYNLYCDVIHPANRPLYEMETTGVHVDQERFVELSATYQLKQDELLAGLREDVGYPLFNPGSVLQVREVLFGMPPIKNGLSKPCLPAGTLCCNLTPIKSTDKSGGKPWEEVVRDPDRDLFQPSTDTETLSIVSSEHEFAGKLRRFKVVNQICKNFLRSKVLDDMTGEEYWEKGLGAYIEQDGRIYTNFRQTLETGRYATSPNLQNLPSKQEKELAAMFMALSADGKMRLGSAYKTVRSLFSASPGHVLVEADWSQAELWTMGGLAKDDDLLHVLATSDLHTVMLRDMFLGVEYKGKKIGDYSAIELKEFIDCGDKWLKSLRTMGKSVVFGAANSIGG